MFFLNPYLIKALVLVLFVLGYPIGLALVVQKITGGIDTAWWLVLLPFLLPILVICAYILVLFILDWLSPLDD